MKSKKLMLIAVLMIGVLALAACGEDGNGDDNGGMYNDGSYTGTAEGYGGEIELEVTIEGDEITGIEVLAQEETEDLGDTAIDDIIDQVIEQQGTEDVEVVSGATASSNATIEAIEAALDEAAAE